MIKGKNNWGDGAWNSGALMYAAILPFAGWLGRSARNNHNSKKPKNGSFESTHTTPLREDQPPPRIGTGIGTGIEEPSQESGLKLQLSRPGRTFRPPKTRTLD